MEKFFATLLAENQKFKNKKIFENKKIKKIEIRNILFHIRLSHHISP